MKTEQKGPRYQARLKVGDDILFQVEGIDLDALTTVINSRLELERSGTVGEIIDLKDDEVVYRCIKQPANE